MKAGDRELWVMEGDFWEIPIFADPIWGDAAMTVRHYELSLAVEVEEEYRSKARNRVAPYQINTGESKVIVNQHGLEQLSWKAAGITPEYYLNLSKPSFRKTVTTPTPNGTNAERFLKLVADKTGRHVDDLVFLWGTMMQEACKWILNRSEPLDLGFAELQALPLRVDWKEKVSALGALKHDETYDHMLSASPENLPELSHDASLKSVGRTGEIGWTIEATPSVSFLELCEKMEKVKFKSLGQCSYALMHQNKLIERQDRIVEIFMAWVGRLVEPMGILHDSGLAGGRCYLPKLALRMPKALPGISASANVWALPEKRKRGRPRNYKAIILSDLPPPQQPEANMRNGRRNMDRQERKESEGPAPGLLVPYPNQGSL